MRRLMPCELLRVFRQIFVERCERNIGISVIVSVSNSHHHHDPAPLVMSCVAFTVVFLAFCYSSSTPVPVD